MKNINKVKKINKNKKIVYNLNKENKMIIKFFLNNKLIKVYRANPAGANWVRGELIKKYKAANNRGHIVIRTPKNGGYKVGL